VFFEGFNLSGARGVRVTSIELGGPHRLEVLSCTIEVEYKDATTEHEIVLEPDTLDRVAFDSFIRLLNRRLHG
jgi:hypothetical protein